MKAALVGALILWGVAATAAAAGPLDRLATEDLLPATRAALVGTACAGPVTADELAPLFDSDRRTPPLDATRLAVCREDLALVPLMFAEFARASLGVRGATDPDIFERLLRGLQALPFDGVRAALLEADHDGIVDAIHARFRGNWLQPLGPDPDNPPMGALSPAQRAQLRAAVRAWLGELLDVGPRGLVWLQTDSGGALTALQVVLQFELVAALIEHGSAEEARIGVEVAKQLPGSSSTPRRALLRRLARADDPELREALAILPDGPASERLPTAARAYATTPVTANVPNEEWLVPPGASAASPSVVGALVGLLLLGLWIGALRRWPDSRRALFPLGALLLGLVALLALEAALTLAGVRPLSELRPTLDPNSVGSGRYSERALEGVPHVVSERGGHRYSAFRVPSPEGTQRVVVLGESSVHGTHYLAEEAFPALLGARLGAEVINVGIGGALSDEIVRAGLEALAWEPDLLVVYFGYNDLTHIPYMDRYRGIDLGGMTLRRALGRIRLARLLRDVIPEAWFAVPMPDGAHLDDREQSTGELLALTDFARRNAVGNLVTLARAAEDDGVAVLLVAQGTNEAACSPGPQDRFALLERGCYRDELGAIGREAAARAGLPLLDAAAMLRALQASRATDRAPEPWDDLFWDGIHPTRLGHAALAAVIAPHARELLDAR